MTEDKQSAYKKIIKSTTLFGGVQIFQIFAALVKNKFAAIFLGAAGMGVSGLLVSSVAFIQTIATFGLNNSAVREISRTNESDNPLALGRSIAVFRKLLMISALAGFIIVMVSSYWLSKFVFGNTDYIFEYCLVSLVVAFNIVSNGYVAILQGTRKLKDLAKSGVFSAIMSVLIIVPIYFFLKDNGIVPALIVASFVALIINYFYARKLKVTSEPVGFKETLTNGSNMAKMGFVVMLTSLMGTLTILLINTFITRYGSLADVGLYQAGVNITNQSIQLVFTAMSIDYFPKLSAISDDTEKVKNLVNQQSEVMLLIITPILLLLILFSPLVIRILLSSEFMSIENFIRAISLGMFFQAANYSMGLIAFAKSDKMTFLMLGALGNILWLGFSVLGYFVNGLSGVGNFFVIHSFVCFVMVYFAVYKKYKYAMSSNFVRLFLISFFPLVGMCLILYYIPTFIGYIVCTLILIAYLVISIIKLNKMIGLGDSLKRLLNIS